MTLKLIEWKDNWNSGCLMMEGDHLTEVAHLESAVEIHKDGVKVGDGVIKGSRAEKGSDDDHGHTYHYASFDFNVTLPPTEVGVNIRELIRQGFQVYGTRLKGNADDPATH